MMNLDSLKLPALGLHDRLDTLLDAPAELLLPERLLLYALVHGLRPRRCLEIGTHFGGATTVIAAALDDVGHGVLVCIDPKPLVPQDVWEKLSHRATMIRGTSPEALVPAYTAANGPFDFVFIDGDHGRDGVIRDVEGVLRVAAPGAHLLFHDSHYWQVAEAIDACLAVHPDRLVDCGTLSTASTAPSVARDGRTVFWGGFRMLRAGGRIGDVIQHAVTEHDLDAIRDPRVGDRHGCRRGTRASTNRQARRADDTGCHDSRVPAAQHRRPVASREDDRVG